MFNSFQIGGNVDDMFEKINKVLKEETDYTMEYGAEQKNKVQVTITGKGDFTGTITKKLKIQ